VTGCINGITPAIRRVLTIFKIILFDELSSSNSSKFTSLRKSPPTLKGRTKRRQKIEKLPKLTINQFKFFILSHKMLGILPFYSFEKIC